MPKIFELSEECASTPVTASDELASARRAVMEAPHMMDIVLGPYDGSRIIPCRLDEQAKVIYPAFEVE